LLYDAPFSHNTFYTERQTATGATMYQYRDRGQLKTVSRRPISQGFVATVFNCGGQFYTGFIENVLDAMNETYLNRL